MTTYNQIPIPTQTLPFPTEKSAQNVHNNVDNVLDNPKIHDTIISEAELRLQLAALTRQLVELKEKLSPTLPFHLTPLQYKLLENISEDKSNTEIAKILNVNEHSVRTYVSKLYKQIQVSNRNQAKQFYINHLNRRI